MQSPTRKTGGRHVFAVNNLLEFFSFAVAKHKLQNGMNDVVPINPPVV